MATNAGAGGLAWGSERWVRATRPSRLDLAEYGSEARSCVSGADRERGAVERPDSPATSGWRGVEGSQLAGGGGAGAAGPAGAGWDELAAVESLRPVEAVGAVAAVEGEAVVVAGDGMPLGEPDLMVAVGPHLQRDFPDGVGGLGAEESVDQLVDEGHGLAFPGGGVDEPTSGRRWSWSTGRCGVDSWGRSVGPSVRGGTSWPAVTPGWWSGFTRTDGCGAGSGGRKLEGHNASRQGQAMIPQRRADRLVTKDEKASASAGKSRRRGWAYSHPGVWLAERHNSRQAVTASPSYVAAGSVPSRVRGSQVVGSALLFRCRAGVPAPDSTASCEPRSFGTSTVAGRGGSRRGWRESACGAWHNDNAEVRLKVGATSALFGGRARRRARKVQCVWGSLFGFPFGPVLSAGVA